MSESGLYQLIVFHCFIQTIPFHGVCHIFRHLCQVLVMRSHGNRMFRIGKHCCIVSAVSEHIDLVQIQIQIVLHGCYRRSLGIRLLYSIIGDSAIGEAFHIRFQKCEEVLRTALLTHTENKNIIREIVLFHNLCASRESLHQLPAKQFHPQVLVRFPLKINLLNHFPMEYPEVNMDAESVEYLIACDICTKLEEHWNISFQKEDIAFIAVLIAGQVKASYVPEVQEDNEHVLFFIQKTIQETFSYYALDFYNESFLPNFAHHIHALIKRARNRQYVTNLVSENVKELHPFIYDVSVHLAHTLEREFQISVIEDEINLLSIYIGLIISPSIGKDYVRVLLICDEYHHIAEYLSNRLQNDFSSKIQVVDVLTSIPNNLTAQNIDLIIHTKPLHILGTKTLLVSPFYQKSDSLAVENVLNQILLEHQSRTHRNLLLTFFDQALFFRNQGIATKEEAIHFLGHHIENIGLCPKGFTESVLKRESLASTCFFESFAIPHAIELNAKFTQFCVLIEENGIQWDDAKISCVFLIAVNEADNKAFSEIYGSLIDFLCDKNALARLIQAKDFTEFISCFE